MNNNLDEIDILNEAPDFDSQRKIIQEEHNKIKLKKKWYGSIGLILFFVVIITTSVFLLLSSYISYDKDIIHGSFNAPLVSDNNCNNVNLKINGSLEYNLNITEGDNCKPKYNVDYFNNRIPTFNIDIYGDKSYIFNSINQSDEVGNCVYNCDVNDDGWPDYNIDLNGDKIIDLNKSINFEYCSLNCDINYDMIADLNLDLNNDGKADVNIDLDHDNTPDLSVDYMGNHKAIFNIDSNNDGKPDTNLINDHSSIGVCVKNCDINNDGFPDYNIDLGNGFLINELVSLGDKKTYLKFGFISDWKCNFIKECSFDNNTLNNTYINIDVTGDGIPDINISSDGGNTINNILNKKYNDIYLNEDINMDGFPDNNIDLDGDNIPDLNITDLSGKCIQNCDFNQDGKADYYVQIKGIYSTIYNRNIDKDYDGKCDYNCDADGDLIIDNQIDFNNDMIADVLQPHMIKSSVTFDVEKVENNSSYVVSNPLSISITDIKPNKDYEYRIKVHNKSLFAIKYSIVLDEVVNSTKGNLYYSITRDGIDYKSKSLVPNEEGVLIDNLIIKGNSSFDYVFTFSYEELENIGELSSFQGIINIEIK